ncbi:uncharacterized protein FIBRA_06080 [Fibroporia radiculosa]|uniref:Nucleotide-diphospho-sugar transferase domain-containing protein n=1 Tax=Fibroporia radiculosa TaxID=599839 RepID=J4GAM4_9APHY|nr:uncharacterized protein FIBRA_06080 [Fibroporia radiculosa]CCM03928.1 predicted protein [Fibroporia radiculosa]
MSIFSRYREYTPIWPEISTSKLAVRRYAVLASAVIVLSGILNVVLLYKSWGRWPTPLDNYQHLNSHPLLNEEFARSLEPPETSRNAIVTTLYTDSYATAIAALGHSLTRVNSTAQRIVFYLPDKISPRALCIAAASGFVPRAISRIAPPHNGKGIYSHFLDQFSKLNIWTLADEGIQGLVYLDADTLVLRNFDELFSLPYNFGAVPDVYIDKMGFSLGFNAGVLFLRPSRAVFLDMLAKIETASFNAHEAEQAFLNHYYGAEALRLPYAYNANLAIKMRQPDLWADLKREMRIVHYTLVKPFLAEMDNSGVIVVSVRDMETNIKNKLGAFGGLFQDELLEWAAIWRETRRTYSDALAECNSASPTVGS